MTAKRTNRKPVGQESHVAATGEPGKMYRLPDHMESIYPQTDDGKPNYPKLEMPQQPQGANIPQGDMPRMDCHGEIPLSDDPKLSNVVPPAKGKPRIMVGIPMLDIKYEFFESFMKFWSSILLDRDAPYEIGYHVAYRKPVHMAEEYLVNTALFNKCTHLLLMDDDIYDVTKEDMEKLLKADKMVIGGVMHASKFPHAMCVFRRYDPAKKVIDMPVDNTMYRLYEVPCLCPKCKTPQGFWDAKWCPVCGSPMDNIIQQADLIPFAFTLINLKIFDKMKKPWFHCTTKYPSDSWFADRVIEAGETEYAHMGVRLNHAGITDKTKPFYVQMGMNKAREGKAVVELSQDQMETHQRLLMNKMREAEVRVQERPQFQSAGQVVANPAGKGSTLITHGK